MEYRVLGKTGLRVSAVGLGGNTFGRPCDEAQTARIVARALELGVTFFDTADIYAQGLSEQYLGRALLGHRRDVVLATKVWGRTGDGPNDLGLARAHIVSAVESSLRRLSTDYVDLYQCHVVDETTPIEETLWALDDLVRQGKVRCIGCSNYPVWRVCEALWASDRRNLTSFASVQQHYNLLDRDVERELLPLCRTHGLALIPYHPLAGGVLTGKYRLDEPPPPGTRLALNPPLQRQLTAQRLRAVSALDSWARERGRTVGELAIAWLLAQPNVATVITGVTSADQVEANVSAGDWVLSADDAREAQAVADGAKGSP